MITDSLFFFCNNAALACWLLLIFLPRCRSLARQVIPVLACGLLGVCYVCLIGWNIRGAEGGFGSLDDVAKLFQNRQVLLAGWIHYLAFDLFIGCWEVRDSQRHRVPHLLIVPALLLTFLFGPAGLLTYYLIRVIRTGSFAVDEYQAVA